MSVKTLKSAFIVSLILLGAATGGLLLTLVLFGLNTIEKPVTVYNDRQVTQEINPSPNVLPTSAYNIGDDNRDGVIDEDESGWDCRTMGNRICGSKVVK